MLLFKSAFHPRFKCVWYQGMSLCEIRRSYAVYLAIHGRLKNGKVGGSVNVKRGPKPEAMKERTDSDRLGAGTEV
jgi:hypothetical protein